MRIHGVCASQGGKDKKSIYWLPGFALNHRGTFTSFYHNHILRYVRFYRCGNPENQKHQRFNTLQFIQQGGGRRDPKQCIRLPEWLAIPIFILKMSSYKILLFLYQITQMLNVKAGTSDKIMSPTTWWLRTTTMTRNSQNLIKERLVAFDNHVNEYLRRLDTCQTG